MINRETLKLVKPILDAYGEAFKGWGLTYQAGVIYGILLLSGEPLEARELSRLAGCSLSTAWSSLTVLERIGLVRRLRSESSGKVGRKSFKFRVNKPVVDVLKNIFRLILLRNIERMLAAISQVESAISGEDKPQLASTIKEIKLLYSSARRVVKAFIDSPSLLEFEKVIERGMRDES